jgi:hypothetical protein
MSYVDNELQAGEEILFKVNRGRKFIHHYKVVSQNVIGLPLLAFFAWRYLSALFIDFPQPTSVDPIAIQILVPVCLSSCIYVPALALIIVGILDLIHFFTDELALTNRRIIGRGQSRLIWPFRTFNLKLSDIVDVKNKGTFLEIDLHRERPVIISKLDKNKEFVDKFLEIKGKR